jgi:hypothetical protein
VGDRAAHAADLYRAGLAPQVVVSGRLLRPYIGMAEIIERDLDSHGVPAASFMKLPHRAANTREEAGALAALVASRGWKRVLVVTSNYHARRTRFIFRHVFPSSETVRVSAAPDSEFDPSHWWETRLGKKLFFNELVGYAVAWWELRDMQPAPGGATYLFPLTPVHSRPYLFPLQRFGRPLAPVPDWKHFPFRGISSFTGVSCYIIVRILPSSPGCFAVAPSLAATEFRLGGISCGKNQKRTLSHHRPSPKYPRLRDPSLFVAWLGTPRKLYNRPGGS